MTKSKNPNVVICSLAAIITHQHRNDRREQFNSSFCVNRLLGTPESGRDVALMGEVGRATIALQA